jgi:uncharacterized protein YjaG (DUF416 family)
MTWQKLDEKELVERLASLSPEGRLAFAASCCERMIPNFEAFVLTEGVEDSKACCQALETIWKWATGQRTSAEDISTLRVRCEEVVAEPERFRSRWTGLATNAVSALMDALDCCLNGSPQSAANTGILADDSVEEYISRVDKPLTSSQVQERGVGFDQWIMGHPLKREELEKQRADIELLASYEHLTPDLMQHLRRSARNFGVQPFRRGLVNR